MATLTPQFFQLLEANEKKIFFHNLSMQEKLWPQLFEKVTSTKAYEDRMRVAGFGTLALKAEGTPIAFDDPVEGTKSRVVHSTFGLGHRITMEMMQDDQFGIMNQMTADLSESVVDHQERLAWGLLDDGFTGTSYTGLGGDTLFETTHVSIRDSSISQSNALSPALSLGQAGIEAMMTMARTTRSEEGRYQNLSQSKLVFHPENEHQAYVLLNTEFITGSANNDRSTVNSTRSGLTPLSVPYLSSTTAWSIHAAPGKNGLKFYMRMPVEFSSAGDPDTKDMKNYVVYRASVAFDEWRNNYGSNAA